ncbi:hypothetical protein BC832DRAFT_231149 [Gaertneriomyces semiglobifer]|nr:hypothetical protein BC832DRAFT_231149 [Gaertneriomyces semiglobifer]
MILSTAQAGQSRPGPPSHVWDHSRPSTAATRDNAASKRLPPIRSSLFNSSDFSEAKTSRHVVFETREPQELQQQRPRATSPRPFSARRQPSAGIRRARPQTAMIADDSRHYVTLGNSSSVGSRHLGPTSKHVDERGNVESTALAPLMGTRMPRQGTDYSARSDAQQLTHISCRCEISSWEPAESSIKNSLYIAIDVCY